MGNKELIGCDPLILASIRADNDLWKPIHTEDVGELLRGYDQLADALEAAEAEQPPVAWLLTPDDVEWVVNDIAELGVKIGNQFFFLYKGKSLVYGWLDPDPTAPPTHDEDGSPMRWRPVFKREFGECAHPVNYDNPALIGTVSLTDSDDWKELPAARLHPAPPALTPDEREEVKAVQDTLEKVRAYINDTFPDELADQFAPRANALLGDLRAARALLEKLEGRG